MTTTWTSASLWDIYFGTYMGYAYWPTDNFTPDTVRFCLTDFSGREGMEQAFRVRIHNAEKFGRTSDAEAAQTLMYRTQASARLLVHTEEPTALPPLPSLERN